MSFLRGFMGKVSVEPVLFFYFITMVFSTCLGTNLLLYKACDPTGAMAQRVGSKCEHEADAQHVVAPINGWKAMVQQIVPVVLVVFAGTWSDRHNRRRRPLIVLPIAGQIVADVWSLYSTVEWSVSPWVTAAMQALALSLTGGPPMLFNGINSYVADTTPKEWRTVKFGVAGGIMTAGGIMGMLVYGYVVVNVGFVFAYLLSIGMGLITMVLTFVFVHDGEAAVQVPYEKLSLYEDFVRTVNPMVVLRNCCRVLTKKRPGHGTLILCLVVLACAPLTCVPLEGEMTVMYLFMRYKFHWNEVDFSIFNAYQMTIVLIGTLFALGILSHKYQVDDAMVGLISSIFDVLAAVAFLLVTQSWELYLVPPLELFRGAAFSITSSIASKCVGSDELGAMNSVKQLTESVMKSLFLPFYNVVYNRTFETMPGAFFFISIVLTAPLVFIFGLIYISRPKRESSDRDNTENVKRNNENLAINDCDVLSYHI